MQEMKDSSSQQGEILPSSNEKANKNFFRDFFGIIFDPKKAYDNIIKAKYWVVMLIVFLLVVGISEQFYHNVLINFQIKTAQEQTEKSGLSSDAMEQQIAFFNNSSLTRPIYFVTTIITQGIFLLIISLIIFFICSVMVGGTAKFAGVWMIYLWTLVITILDTIIKTPLMIIKNDMRAGLNLGLFFGPESKLGAAMSAVDIFTVWQFIVLGFGLAALYKFTVKRGMTISMVLWALYTIIFAIIGYVS